MIGFCLKNKGTISVFLTLILIPTLLFGGVMIDGTRIYGSKNLVSGAGDLAMNAALAGYDASLNDAYGLIAMSKTPEELETKLQEYFVDTLNAQGLTEDDMARALIYVDLINDSSFDAKAVPGTEIYETEVIKQQILEHMKYRAPVLMIENGILDRVKELKNMEAEQKAVQSQMDFESEISDLVELFEKLDKQINEERNIYETLGKRERISGRLGEIHAIYSRTALITIAHQRVKGCTETVSRDKWELIKWCNSLADEVTELTEQTVGVDTEKYFEKNFENILKIKRIKNSVTDPAEVYRGLNKKSDEYKERNAEVQKYEQSVAKVNVFLHAWKERANEETKNAQSLANLVIFSSQEAMKYCDDMLKSVEEIEKKMEELQSDYNKWKTNVENIPGDSSNKASYQKTVEEYKEFFDDAQYLDEFVRKVEQNKKFYTEVEKTYKELTFTGTPITDMSACTYYIEEANNYVGSIKNYWELTGKRNQFLEKCYGGECFGLPGDLVYMYEDLTPENDMLVKRIKEYWVKEGEVDEAEAENAGNDYETTLSEKIDMYTNLLLTKDIDNCNIKVEYSNDIPSVWLGVATPADVGGNTDVSVSGNLNNKGDRKKITNETSDTMDGGTKSIKGFSSLGNVLQGAAESAYITEYVVDMFSYYTSNWEGTQNEVGDYVEIPEPKSLSEISLKDNALYRAEVEYILWGDPDLQDNVRNTKAVIFALHLTSNLIYATANLSGQATAMAATIVPPGPWTTVVKIALISIAALEKSADDLNRIVHGEGVELYKSKTSGSWATLFSWDKSRERKEFQFTYRDYLWLFIMINLVQGNAKQRALLARTADCIELNMTEKKSKAEASIKNKYTMIQVDADVITSTFFLQRISSVNKEAEELPGNAFEFHYTGVQGY